MKARRLLPVIAIATACSPSAGDLPLASTESTCSRSAALVAGTLRGTSAAPKQLALTFDDGPGDRTLELSAWLAAEGIAATFFVVGDAVATHPGVLAQLVANGHRVANHTQHHQDLTSTTTFPLGASGDALLLAAVADDDTAIQPFVTDGRFLFRAPFGAYDTRAHGVLHASAMDKYVGPVGWDVGGTRTATTAADWACWQNAPKLTTKACGDLYLAETNAVGRGIVLLHDADYGDGQNHALTSGIGNTVDMTKYLVPLFRAQGFSFVRAEDIPEIAALLPAPPPVDAGSDATVADGGVDEAGPSDAAGLDSALPDGGSVDPPTAPPEAGSAPSIAGHPSQDQGAPCGASARSNDVH